MTTCSTCGTPNVDGVKFCVNCGTQLAPAAESWRTPDTETAAPPTSSGSNTYTAPPSYPSTYTPPTPQHYGQSPYNSAQGGEPMHPAIPAIISLFIPSLGLLFVPNKAGLGLGILAAYVVLSIVLTVFTVITFGLGGCLFFLFPLINIAAAVHSYDEAAKASGGKFAPVLFKK